MTYRPRNRIWTPAALTASAVDLTAMKEHLRVVGTDEDALIGNISVAATSAVERWTQRLLIPRQAVLRLPDLPTSYCPIELPGGVVTAVASVVADGNAITGPIAYGDSPAVLVPATEWPTVTGEGYPVAITYTAGFATVPEELRSAVKLIAADLYDVRSESSPQTMNVVPISAEWLMRSYRIGALTGI
jgi:uncharacterized phiE125 gp8 family phage protein